MTFQDHLENNRQGDGYHLDGAEADRAAELAADPGAQHELAKKAAHAERLAYEAGNRERLHAEFKAGQQAFDLGTLDTAVLVPLGDSVAVPLGEMNAERIRLRKDLRTKKHLDESEAFKREMEFWYAAEHLLPPGGSIEDIR